MLKEIIHLSEGLRSCKSVTSEIGSKLVCGMLDCWPLLWLPPRGDFLVVRHQANSHHQKATNPSLHRQHRATNLPPTRPPGSESTHERDLA
ncbi:hypothetical protein MRB53_037614 [Persea americana]|nr:hypothetical protein MRB53_037614 [Persea americana]